MTDEKSPLLGLLGRLGLPTRNSNGHDLGCRCAECSRAREEHFGEMLRRVQAGEKPATLGELLMWSKKKKSEH